MTSCQVYTIKLYTILSYKMYKLIKNDRMGKLINDPRSIKLLTK